MYFKRKAYDRLIEWKENYANEYAALLEGARRVGKSTIAETFARNEYKSYVMLDFSKVSDNIRKVFDDIGDLDLFFLRLQAENDVYAKFLSDKLPSNLGYLYENLAAQMLATTDRELFYHTWEKKDSTHYYEVDFLCQKVVK